VKTKDLNEKTIDIVRFEINDDDYARCENRLVEVYYLVNPDREKLNKLQHLINDRHRLYEELEEKYNYNIPYDTLSDEEKMINNMVAEIWSDEVSKFIKDNFQTIDVDVVEALI
jgi:hypothetical protein